MRELRMEGEESSACFLKVDAADKLGVLFVAESIDASHLSIEAGAVTGLFGDADSGLVLALLEDSLLQKRARLGGDDGSGHGDGLDDSKCGTHDSNGEDESGLHVETRKEDIALFFWVWVWVRR